MRIFVTTMAGLWYAAALWAAEPQGEYVELHSCEVYTGGCTASAWSTLGGRSVVRVWKFEKASENGIDLAGLSVAVLEVGTENLAMKGNPATASVVYLPEAATPEQRVALLTWVRAKGDPATVSKVVPISYRQDGAEITVQAGKEIFFSTRAIAHCDSGSCGESLWYEPRGDIGAYTVLVNDEASIAEPALQLAWKDNSSKSVFFGHFGHRQAAVFSLASIP